jgi:Fic family protein
METIFNRIEELVNEIKSLPPISSENLKRLNKKFRLEFNYNSNHIEGNTLTYGETELLLFFDKTDGLHELREFEEMKAHDVAYKIIQEWATDIEQPLTETYIKQINEIILVRPFWKEAITPDGQSTRRQIKVGQYKEYPNSVRLQNGEMFEYASPTDTPIKMNELVQWYNAEIEKDELHPVALAALLHYKFVLIHPFDDGNGRISRLLMNYVLIKNDLPPIIIKTTEKKKYLNALNQADVGNIEAFVNYIGEQLIWSLEIKIKATKGESIEEVDDVEKEIQLFKKAQLVNINKSKVKTKDLTYICFVKNINPFLISFDDKINTFKDLFESFESKFSVNIFPNITRFAQLSDLEDIIKESNNISSIDWSLNFVNSINGKIKSVHFNVEIKFEATQVVINFQKNEIIKIDYDVQLSSLEIDKVVNDCIKIAFNIIRDNTIN